MYQAMLKSVGFKFQVQLTVEKGRKFLSSSTNRELGSTDRELDLTNRKSQEQNFAKFLNQAQARENVQGFIPTSMHIKGKP